MVGYRADERGRDVYFLAWSHARTQLPETSPQMILRVKQGVVHLGLDASHFITPRTWSDGHLKRAIEDAQERQVIAGRVMILLRTYPQYIVGNAAGLMASRPGTA